MRIRDGVGPCPAHLVRHGDAEHAELRHLLVEFGREALGLVEFGGDAADFAVGELARGVAHHLVAILCAAVEVGDVHLAFRPEFIPSFPAS